MALIICTECGREISDKAAACPGCGAPQPVAASAAPAAAAVRSRASLRRVSPLVWVVLVLVALGLGWLFQSATFREIGRPPMPVEVGFRKALLGPGLVLDVTNNSERQLSVLVDLTNPTTKQEKSFRMDIAAHDMGELGHAEGWALASGDAIRISHHDYKSWTGSAP